MPGLTGQQPSSRFRERQRKTPDISQARRETAKSVKKEREEDIKAAVPGSFHEIYEIKIMD